MAVKPVIVCLSDAGSVTAMRLGEAFSAPVHGRLGRVTWADEFFPNALDHIRNLFAAGVPIIGVCASGILVRAIAPLIADKRSDPPVVSVSDDGAVAVPLIGGHHGANRIAQEISDVLGATAAITTAGDIALGFALDVPPEGWVLANPDDAKSVMSEVLGGAGIKIVGQNIWDIESDPNGSVRLIATEQPISGNDHSLVFHPKKHALGVGCARGCAPEEMWELVSLSLTEANISPYTIASVGSLDLKADEPAVHSLAARLNVPFRVFNAEELEVLSPRLANPSDIVFEEVGCHGVAEGAALALAGHDSTLFVEKQKTLNATCAIATNGAPILEVSGRSRGHLALVGIGPGQASWRTPEASDLVQQADELVGYGLYIDLLGPLAAGKKRSDFPLGGEENRCRYALEEAAKGKRVALICSGDAGIYAMGALVFELLHRGTDEEGVSDAAKRVEVISTPGVSALQGAAARAGAPLGHDFCAISLSDLLTPREDIIRRIKAAAYGDFVIAFYNPVSERRRTLLAEAREILLRYRPSDTPVMLASSLGRPAENIRYRKLSDLDVDEVDMLTVVLIGSSQSKLAPLGDGDRMYTPRGYARKIDGDLS